MIFVSALYIATDCLHAASRLATENFVKGGLATKTGPDDVATAIAVAVDGKQDSLPSAAGNEGKVLGVTDVFGSIGWVSQSETDISGKADLQAGDTAGNVAVMDGGGQYIDSGSALSSLATVSAVNSALGDIKAILIEIKGTSE